MKHSLFVSALALSLGTASVAPTLAGGVGGALQDAASALGYSSAGSFVSGELYGNTSNPRSSGNGVLPSESPGPWECGSVCSDPTAAGGSMGDWISPATSGGKSQANFANDKSPGPDFVK